MAKYRFQNFRRINATRTLLLAALSLGLGSLCAAADQQTPKPSTRTSATAPASVPKKAPEKTPAPPPLKSIKNIVHPKTKISPAQRAATAEGKRDPFKLPIYGTGKPGGEGMMNSAPGGALPPGVRGLLISQLRLEGVVRQQI